jgi:Domain of unknown function (DUF4276)
MPGRIVFLTEEPSMSETLRAVLPRLFPHWVEDQHWLVLTHRGKTALEASIPKKLAHWHRPADRFVILRDNDGSNCKRLKARLCDLASARPASEVLVRIVCQELESWFLGDLAAVRAAYGRLPLQARQDSRTFRDPDRLTNAADELEKLTGIPGKVARAATIAPHLQTDPTRNQSASFGVFITGLQRLVVSLPPASN